MNSKTENDNFSVSVLWLSKFNVLDSLFNYWLWMNREKLKAAQWELLMGVQYLE